MKTTNKLAKPIILALGLALMLTCFTGCVGIGNTYTNADKYSAGDLDYDGEITELDINWSAGSVNVSHHTDSSVTVTETCKKDLSDAKKVHTWIDGKTLHIQYSKSGEAFLFENYDKKLEIKLPENIKLTRVSYDGSSADTVFDGIKADKFDIDTSSGDITLDSCEADEVITDSSSGDVKVDLKGDCKKISADSSSGNVTVSAGEVKTAKFDTSSGKVKADFEDADSISADSSSGDMTFKLKKAPSKMDIDASSGDITLYLSKDSDFKIEVDTSSGDFESDISLSKSGDTYTNGSGGGKISIDTSSGDVYVKEY
ncbi:MAG: DUF4097 family beta strand repeat protein [Ruminococcus sp.]|nr:DUF4097 family beta strand repeat protein [Ruminococcus sp.]